MVVTNQQAVVRPRIVGRYALFDEIAAGGMATIHLGRLVGPVGFSRTVAIKTLHPQFAKDPEFVEMFLEEARLASRIQHPNVISTVDVATADGEVFLVMEYVAGESLAKLVRSALKKGERMPLEVAASVLAGMLHGLHATHEAKNEQLEPMHIVHRDVSPQNVLVGLDGIARIFDFGVAKAAAMRSQATSDGQMKGKLSYMSPEQLNSREVDRRTDIFAAGVVAWECLVGRRLFAGSDPGEVLAKVLTLEIPAPIEILGSIPRAVSDTVMRALERSPEQRWQTARDFAIELERNVSLAAPHMVGDWVERNASDALRDRRHRVEAVERASVDLAQLTTAADILPPSSRVPAPASEPVEFASSGSGTSRASSLSLNSNAAPQSSAFARQIGVTALLAALGAAIAAGVWYWRQNGVDPAHTRPATSVAPEPTRDRQHAAPKEPAPPSPPPGPAPVRAPTQEAPNSPPVLQVDSLPEQRDAADAGSNEDTATARTQTRGQEPSPRPRRGRRSTRGTSPRAEATARAPVPAPAPAEPAPPEPAAPAAKPECEPPWYIDAKGIQRLKPKCL